MKLRFTFFLTLVLFTGLVSRAQTVKVLEPGVDFLNNLIVGDTAANGSRVETIYVLKRDAEYLVSGVFENHGWKLHIRAQEGTGKLPVIRAYPDLNGAISWGMIRLYGDATIENIHIDQQPSDTSLQPTAWGFVSYYQGLKFDIEGCTFTNAGQGGVGIFAAADYVKINNSKFYNMGNVNFFDLGNGRLIDCRDSEFNLLSVTNNTIINSVDRIIRHRNGSGVLKNVIIDHNTIVNNGAYHGFMELGNVGKSVTITNNLMVDAMGLGADQTDATRLTELNAHGETDANGNPTMVWVGTIPNDTTVFTIDKNIYTVSSKLNAFYTSVGVNEGPDQILTEHIKGKLGAGISTAWVKKDVTLADTPEAMTELYTWYYSPSGADKKKVTTTVANYDKKSNEYWLNTVDCKYTVADADFNGTDQVPVGDPNWGSSIVTSVKEINGAGVDFKIYPNPFSDFTTVQFKIERNEDVTVKIFDITGKSVKQINFGNLNAGLNKVVINKENLLSGIYFVKLEAGSKVSMQKIIVK